MSVVEYKLDGESAELVSSLEQAIRALTQTTQAANDAREATKKLTAEQKAAAAEAKKSGDAYGGTLSVLRAFGGQTSATVEHVNNLTKGLGQLTPALGDLGAVAVSTGLGITGLVAAGAGLVSTLVSIGRAAAEAGDKIGDPRVKELDSSIQSLDSAWENLEVTIATTNPAIETAIHLVTGIVTEGTNLLGVLDKVGTAFEDEFGTKIRVALAGATGGMSELLRATISFFVAAGDTGEVADNIKQINKLLDDKGTAIEKAAAEAKKAAEEEKADAQHSVSAGEELIQTIHDIAAAKREQAAATKAAEKAAEEEVLNELRWGQSFLEQVKALAKEQDDAAIKLRDLDYETTKQRAADAKEYIEGVGKQLDQETDEYEKQLKAQQKILKDAVVQAAQFVSDTFTMVSDAQTQSYEDQISGLDDQITKQQQLVEKLQASDDATDKARVQSALDRLKGLTAEKKRIAYDEFIQQKQAAVGEALLQGAVAVMTAFAQLGPIAGAIASAFIAGTTTIQVGIIQAQKPPAHDGAVMGADEFNVGSRKVRNGEAAVIFNQRAVQSGALDQAVRANRDQGSGSSTQQVRLVLADAGRVVGELIARETRRSGSPLAAGSPGVVDPYGRAR